MRRAVNWSTAEAQVAVKALQDAAGAIARAGRREIEAVSKAARDSLQRFMTTSERAARSATQRVRMSAQSAAKSTRKAGRRAKRRVSRARK